MKFGITGHTSGIGKAIADEAIKQGHEVVGFSRSNGYDISIDTDQERIVAGLADCDIFVNNSHERFFQVELFSRVWRAWRDSPKKIVNIGSAILRARAGQSSANHQLGIAHYAAEKAGLDMASNWAWNDHQAQCEVVMVGPGLTNTPRNAEFRKGDNKIDPVIMAQFVMSSLSQPFLVREIIISPSKRQSK